MRLYLEDFYSIVEVLKGQCDSIRIVADRFLIEEPKEIESLNQPVVRSLEIETPTPFIRITLSSHSSVVWVSEDDPKAIGLFSKITEILARSQSPWRFILRNWFFPVLLAIWIGGNLLSFLVIGKYQLFAFLAAGALFTAGFIAAFILGRSNFLLFLERKSAKKGFLKRKRDDLLLAVIAAIVGALLTLLGTWLLGGFR